MSTAALVVTTYNNPRYLGVCLASFANQTSEDFDVFIADDGSKDETRAKIAELGSRLKRPVTHVWHPDDGYRKTLINNEVFRRLGDSSESQRYRVVICVDHDTIAHRRFIEDHLAAHAGRERACFMGRRVELGPKLSAAITEENVGRFNRGMGLSLLSSGLSGDTRNWGRSVRIRNPRLRRWLGRDDVPDLLGSNFSVSRALLFEVNGYNEDYRAYWGEDGDLFVRLRNVGAALFGSKSLAIQYHLDHRRLEPSEEHRARYRELLLDTTYRRCANGIAKAP